jgi:FtsP/CotA-like multicopper oxidase with cupredoxin domain/peroxiredoxin
MRFTFQHCFSSRTGAPRFALFVNVCATTFALAQQGDPAVYNQQNRAQTLNRDVSFVDPPEYSSATKATRLVLQVRQAVNDFNGIALRHRSYNGGLVGPVIRVRPGTELLVRLQNRLPSEVVGEHELNVPHDYNTTNLHTHGLHVSPKSPADDVFLQIRPSEEFDYCFQIPEDHPAGTFWYHAHKHGSTALQLASGMAGALIVEGGLDEVPEIQKAKEHTFVLQQFVYREIPGEEAIVHPQDVYEHQISPTVAINGQVTPTIVMRPGEVQRWRLIHAGINEPIELRLEGIDLHEIAVDGLALGTIVKRASIELQPGNRSDVLIKAPSDHGTYLLTTQVAKATRSSRSRVVEAKDVLKLVIAGAPIEMDLPDEADLKKLAPYTDADVPQDHELAQHREIRMDGLNFAINGRVFEPDFFAIKPKLGTAEEWSLVGSFGGHPFHVHVNPFAVRVDDEDPNPNRWVWRDTHFVEFDQTVKIRSWFKRFPGKTVLHCHMLDHEDKGMMQAIEILGNDREEKSFSSSLAPARTLASRRAIAADADWTADNPLKGSTYSLKDTPGRIVLLVFHRGVRCIHCAQQLRLLAAKKRNFDKLGIELVAICQTLPPREELAAIQDSAGITFSMLSDPKLKIFQKFDCINSEGIPLHGLFLIGPNRNILWSSVDEAAELDIDRILSQSRRHLNDLKFKVQHRSTSEKPGS